MATKRQLASSCSGIYLQGERVHKGVAVLGWGSRLMLNTIEMKRRCPHTKPPAHLTPTPPASIRVPLSCLFERHESQIIRTSIFPLYDGTIA
jgi:hypothetical protein